MEEEEKNLAERKDGIFTCLLLLREGERRRGGRREHPWSEKS